MNPVADPSIALGWQLLQAGNLAAADEVVRPFLSQGRKDELVPLIGAIRLQQGRFAEAAPMFERARTLHPGEPRFAFLHGTALAGMQQFEPAVSAFQAVIKMAPNIADVYLALGQAQRKLGQSEDAQNTYRKLLRIQPENVDAYIALSSALAETGQFAEAEAPLRRALQYARDPQGAGRDPQQSGDRPEQPEQARRSAGRAGAHPGAGAGHAEPGPAPHRQAFQLGRYDECLDLYRKLLDRNPADVPLHRAYNSLLYRLGRKDAYLTSFDRAPQTRDILLAKANFLRCKSAPSRRRTSTTRS